MEHASLQHPVEPGQFVSVPRLSPSPQEDAWKIRLHNAEVRQCPPYFAPRLHFPTLFAVFGDGCHLQHDVRQALSAHTRFSVSASLGTERYALPMPTLTLRLHTRLSSPASSPNLRHLSFTVGKYKFYLEILFELVQSVLYMGFFVIILWNYGIPIHLVRELFITLRSFKKTIVDFLRYRKLINCLNERYEPTTLRTVC